MSTLRAARIPDDLNERITGNYTEAVIQGLQLLYREDVQSVIRSNKGVIRHSLYEFVAISDTNGSHPDSVIRVLGY
jgi:hypothetical protein